MLKLVLGTHNLTSPITAYSRPEVFTKSQSYFFAHSLKTMEVTSTAKGITSKQVLLGTIGDQVRFHISIIDVIFGSVFVKFIMYAACLVSH